MQFSMLRLADRYQDQALRPTNPPTSRRAFMVADWSKALVCGFEEHLSMWLLMQTRMFCSCSC